MRINSIFFATAIALFVCVDALPTPTSNQHPTLRSLRDRAEQNEEERGLKDFFKGLKGSSSTSTEVDSLVSQLRGQKYDATAAFHALNLHIAEDQSVDRLKAWVKYVRKTSGRGSYENVAGALLTVHRSPQEAVDYLLSFKGDQALLQKIMTPLLTKLQMNTKTSYDGICNLLHLVEISKEELLASRNFKLLRAYTNAHYGDPKGVIIDGLVKVFGLTDVRNMLIAGTKKSETEIEAKELLKRFKKM